MPSLINDLCRNKLECSSLASNFSLAQYLWDRLKAQLKEEYCKVPTCSQTLQGLKFLH
jgi:hypothetical protein